MVGSFVPVVGTVGGGVETGHHTDAMEEHADSPVTPEEFTSINGQVFHSEG